MISAIDVTGLGKAYRQYPTRWSRLAEWVLPWRGPRHALHWVLRDISFSVQLGEAVGIMGINGAGKSTLLKIIAGTTQPTTGTVQTRGQVSALLELGMGFHPDFTGRQNVYMAGQLLGLSAADVSELMPKIEAFAEIHEYIDQPVRVYSSGMQMRLAFSVATAKRPDVLIVDEALSVGDAYFQHKSFDCIRKYRAAGTSLLIVSHDKQVIQSMCDRAILLDGGQVAKEGAPESVMDFYNALLADRQHLNIVQQVRDDGRVQTISGTGQAHVAEVVLLDEGGAPVDVVDVGAPVTLKVVVSINERLPQLVLGYMIKDRLGQPVYGTNTHHLDSVLLGVQRGDRATFQFRFNAALGPGTYSVAIALHSGDSHVSGTYEWRDLALTFTVVNMTHQTFVGNAWLPPDVLIEHFPLSSELI